MIKRRLTFLLLILAGSALTLLWGTNSTAESQTGKRTADSAERAIAETKDSDTTITTPEIIAYYFRTTYRCASCRKIEAYSKEAIENGFAEQIESGTIKFASVNIDEAENKHFVKDYKLYTKSLVICDMEDGEQVEWKNLTRVWQLIRNKQEFVKYVQDEINAYLKEN